MESKNKTKGVGNMNFATLIQEIKNGKTFEEICVTNDFEMVECIGNVVYDDQDLFEFLEELGAEISDYGNGYVFIRTDDGRTYKVPKEDRPNRFDPEYPDETVLFFGEIQKLG